MLPITNRKTLEIPHGLAALAAAVCLVLAFATDQSAVEERLQASQSANPPAEHAAEDHSGSRESVPVPVREQRERREQRESSKGLGLLPWFPGLGGRG